MLAEGTDVVDITYVPDDSMTEIIVSIRDENQIELESADVGVADGVLAFDISGTIRSDAGDLDAVGDVSLIPTEVRFMSVDSY